MNNSRLIQRTRVIFIIVFIVCVLFLGLWSQLRPVPITQALETQPANCRYGVNNLTGNKSNQWISTLGAGWWIDYNWRPRGLAVPTASEHYPQIRMRQDRIGDTFLPTYVVTPALDFSAEGLGTTVLNNPGHIWIVGNEPDVDNIAQDSMMPQMYAQAYYEIYHFIKGLDANAQIANGGLSMITPGRLQYLNIVWDTYQSLYGEPMPVDVWNMHLYILSEIRPWDGGYSDGKIAIGTDPAIAIKAPYANQPPAIECAKADVYCRAEHDDIDIFIQQVRSMRQWMKNHGQQNKPLILSEYSQLYPFVDYDDPINPTECFLMDEFGQCFTAARVTQFMQNTINYLNTATDPALGYPQDGNRLVQQWNWFSMITFYGTTGSSSDLLKPNYLDYTYGDPAALTQMGSTYRNIIAAEPTTVNLVAGSAPHVAGHLVAPATTADAIISVNFFNNGTTSIIDPFAVTFYADAAMTTEIGTAVIDPATHGAINGCAWGRNSDKASVLWTNLAVGTHTYWVKIDSNDDINNETNANDNIATGQVTIFPRGNRLPIIQFTK